MRIRELREAANLQQKQVAAHMGVLQTAVSNWETEVALPKARELPRLARVLGCSIDDLFVPLEEVG
ncbi:MAG: helix-turn-helix domain-containing protein [Oscillospiraceae bacterium]|nr:helix-turn-helix domain-containing protein [Oscillospiraceae bacterium]